MNYKKMSFDDILNWCKENNQTEWLKQTVNAKMVEPDVIAEDGSPVIRDITYIEIKLRFAQKFMPEILPIKKEKKPTMKDRLKDL